MMQNVRTEPKGNPKAYKGTPRGEVRAEFRFNKKEKLRKGGVLHENL